MKPNRIGFVAVFAAGVASGIVLLAAALALMARPGVAAAQGEQPFPDVPANHWAAKAVADLKEKGIVTAADPKTGAYDGSRYVTRYEAAVLIDRFVHYVEQGRKPLHATLVAPQDMPDIAPGPGHDAMVDLAAHKFLQVSSPLFEKPSTANVTAAQMSDAVAQAVNRVSDRATAPNKNGAPED